MLITLDNLKFSYTGTPVFSNVTFAVNEGEKIGFIGGNGAGKSTLIKLMLGELIPEEGTVTKKNGITIGYLPQNGGFEYGDTVYKAMAEVFARDEFLIGELARLQQEISSADEKALPPLLQKCERIEKEILSRDSYHYDVKIRTVLGGMGFGDRAEQVVSTMSGGEKTKLKLCRLLLEKPDLLVLDEPTNHLDLNALFWLEDYLASFKGALFVVSHDRYFLDKLTSRTLELENGTIVSYKGNYSKYRVLKEERYFTQLREYEKQLEKMRKMQDYVDRNLVRATTAKSAQSRVKQLDKMTLEKPAPPEPPARFSFTYDTEPYERVLYVPRFDLSAGGKTLLKNAEFTLMRGEKCALVGDNGTGKSTLLKFLLSGDRAVTIGKFVKIAYYDQENAMLQEDETALNDLRFRFPLYPLTDAYKLLAQSGINAENAQKKVCELSGGLKAKLALAILQAEKGNFLVLDEPTNHLDLDAREALETALQKFEGTLLFVSHDRRFIESIATGIISIENGTLTKFTGSYKDYLEQKSRREPERKTVKPEKAQTESYKSKSERAKEAQKRTRIKEIETRFSEIEREEETLSEELVRSAADYNQVRILSEKLSALHAESDALLEEYGTLI